TVANWKLGLVFGALIAATDPVAVTALFSEVGAPKRLATLVEAESLFNDGVGVVALTLVVSYVGGEGGVSPLSLSWMFFAEAGGGLAVGLAIGFLVSQLIRRVGDPMIEIGLTMIAAYGSFALGDAMHVSGVLATVAAGLFCSSAVRDHAGVAAETVRAT